MPLISKRNSKEPIRWRPPANDSISLLWWLLLKWRPLALLLSFSQRPYGPGRDQRGNIWHRNKSNSPMTNLGVLPLHCFFCDLTLRSPSVTDRGKPPSTLNISLDLTYFLQKWINSFFEGRDSSYLSPNSEFSWHSEPSLSAPRHPCILLAIYHLASEVSVKKKSSEFKCNMFYFCNWAFSPFGSNKRNSKYSTEHERKGTNARAVNRQNCLWFWFWWFI